MIYLALILVALSFYCFGSWCGWDKGYQEAKELQECGRMPTTSRERYRLFEICTVQRADGTWSVRWASAWGGKCGKLNGESPDGSATMALAVERARAVVDAYWECEAEEHWAELVERGYVEGRG